MKKVLFSLIALVATVSVAHADPRFGAIGYNTGGVGVFVTDDAYNASLTYTSNTSDNGGVEDTSKATIGLAANYKIAVDSMTALTAGLAYSSTTGEEFFLFNQQTADIDSATQLDLNVGVEKSIASNLTLTAEVSVYRSTSVEFDGAADPILSSGLFQGGRVGLAYSILVS